MGGIVSLLGDVAAAEEGGISHTGRVVSQAAEAGAPHFTLVRNNECVVPPSLRRGGVKLRCGSWCWHS
jgi:hypothetical protein